MIDQALLKSEEEQRQECEDKLKEGQEMLKDLERKFEKVEDEIKDFLDLLNSKGDEPIDPEMLEKA